MAATASWVHKCHHLSNATDLLTPVPSPLNYGRWVGQNCGPIFSHLWTKVHKIKFACAGVSVVCNAVFRLTMSYYILQIFAIKSWSCAKSRKIWCFWAAKFRGKGPPKFLTEFYKSGSPSTTWQCSVTISQATLEIRWRKKKTKERSKQQP